MMPAPLPSTLPTKAQFEKDWRKIAKADLKLIKDNQAKLKKADDLSAFGMMFGAVRGLDAYTGIIKHSALNIDYANQNREQFKKNLGNVFEALNKLIEAYLTMIPFEAKMRAEAYKAQFGEQIKQTLAEGGPTEAGKPPRVD